MKLLFFDLETTGLSPEKNGIHQISGEIVIDGVTKEKFDFKTRPNPKCKIEKEALDIAGVTEVEVLAYPPMEEVFKALVTLLAKYVDKFNKKDKYFLVGYNNASFDNQFFREYFTQNGDNYFGSWFWSNSLDVMVLATNNLLDKREDMVNFKLQTVAKEYGITLEEEKLHDATYDLFLTKTIFDIIVKTTKQAPEMSNVNNYRFSEVLKTFENKLVIPQRTKVANASKIMNNPNHPWADETQKKAGEEQFKAYKAWLDFYETFYAEGLKLCIQHEQLTDKVSKIYDRWYSDISNEGKQETELMSSQADMLCELMGELYKELLPLNLPGMKPPQGLNLK